MTLIASIGSLIGCTLLRLLLPYTTIANDRDAPKEAFNL